MVSLFGPGFDSPQLHYITLMSLAPAGFLDLKVKATSSMTTPRSSTKRYAIAINYEKDSTISGGINCHVARKGPTD